MTQNSPSILSGRPRIAHVWTTFYPDHGAMKRTLVIAEDQRQRGWEVEFIIGYNVSPKVIQETRRRGFSVTQVASLRKYIYPHLELIALIDLVRLFHKKKFQLVHTHTAKAGIIGRLAACIARVPHVLHTVYGPTFAPSLTPLRRLTYWSLEILAGKMTDKFIFVGQDLRSHYLRAGICTPHNSQVIYGGRDLTPFFAASSLPEAARCAGRQALGLAPQAGLIGYVARLVPSKGHTFAIRAFHQAKPYLRGAKMIFVGEGRLLSEQAYQKKLIEVIKNLGLQNEIIFTGWVDNPSYYYGLFDILIFPSLYEGLPGAVIEAAAADLPVVGFDCGGVREILGDKATLVPVRDVEGLAKGLKREMAHLEERRLLRGRKVYELNNLKETFSIARMVEETYRIYNELLLHN
jgi:glycosyltransferase involved in cell wall biosynthesis